MPTNFETQFSSSADDQLLDGFGETVSYVSYGNAAANITAKWTPGQLELRHERGGDKIVRMGLVECKMSDITTVDDRDYFTIDGANWAVDRVVKYTPMVLFSVYTKDERWIGGANTRLGL